MLSPRGVDGGIQLECRVNEIGRTCISNQYFSPPVHLSKPYFDKESASLLVNLSCPTAGLLEGDRVVSSIEVGSGASLVVTTPGATRAHFMRSGLALVEQRFVVRTGGFLEFNPGALILQRQANLRQDTILEIEEGGEALLVEKLLPGRLAHGEIFRFDRFASRLRVRMKGRLALLESFRLSPEDASILPWKKSFPEPIYGAFYLFSEKVSEGLPSRDEIHAMATGKLLVGSSALNGPGGWIIKLLAADALSFKGAVNRIRELLHCDLGRKPTAFRRY